MVNFANNFKRSSVKFVTQLVVAAAVAASGAASAGVLDFEGPNSLNGDPILLSNQSYLFNGGFVVQTASVLNTTGDLAGLLIDGSDNGLCFMSCPVNNQSNYLALLADSYMYIYMLDGSKLRVSGLSASFIGDSDSYPAVAGLLVLQGYSYTTGAVGGSIQVGLPGPDSTGQFNFRDYSLGSFANTQIDYLRILGYACDSTGSCNRNLGLANFAIDNVRTVPEPGSIALFGLAAAGVLAARRRRAA